MLNKIQVQNVGLSLGKGMPAYDVEFDSQKCGK